MMTAMITPRAQVSFEQTLASWPTELVTFAGLTVNPSACLLFIVGQAPIALGADQARVLHLLIQERGGFVEVERIKRETVNTVATTVDSLDSLLRNVGGLSAIVHDPEQGFQLVDATADLSLGFADLRLNQTTRLLLVGGQARITMSPQNTAVLGLLMAARGGPVTGRELKEVTGNTAPGAAVGNLSRRLKSIATSVVVINERSCGWRLVAAAA